MIDKFSRFSAGCMRTKQSSEIVGKFITYWIAVYCVPEKLYSDNGGEFNNVEFRDMAENFNIEVKMTAAFNLWSNGLLERHNCTLTVTLQVTCTLMTVMMMCLTEIVCLYLWVRKQ